jgi:hypothetical protein
MDQAAADLSALTSSKAYKSYMKCLSKDSKLKPRVDQLNQIVKQVLAEVKVLQREMAAAQQGKTKDLTKIIDLTKQMMEHLEEFSKIEANRDLIEYSIKSCPDELVEVTVIQKDIKKKSLKNLRTRVEAMAARYQP